MLSERFACPRSTRTLDENGQRAFQGLAAGLERGDIDLEPTQCVCRHRSASEISRTDRYGLPLVSVVCLRCGTLRFDPYFTVASLAEFYRTDYQLLYQRLSDPEFYRRQQRLYAKRAQRILKNLGVVAGRLCEVGCGAGGSLDYFNDNGWTVCGVEPSEMLRDLVADSERPHQVVDDIENLSAGGIDVFLMHHVLEHVHDPSGLMQSCRERISDRGIVLIAVPDYRGLRYSEFSYGDLMPFLHVSHKYNFTSAGLEILAASVDGEFRRIQPPQMKTHCSNMPEIWGVLEFPAVVPRTIPSPKDWLGDLKAMEIDFQRKRTSAHRRSRWQSRLNRMRQWISRW